MIGMHAPDGFLHPHAAVVTALVSVIVIAIALWRATVEPIRPPARMAAATAAFIFAAQMFNFPVASGTTGHLIGGTLAAILLGPWAGMLTVTTVVVVQAVAFADGGITALGYNVLNMAVVPALGGWVLFCAFRRLLPTSTNGVVVAGALASAASVVLAAIAFSLEWLVGAGTTTPFTTVFGAMVGIHALIGIGEGLIGACVLGAVLASRPDLVVGARDLELAPAARSRAGDRAFWIGAGVTTALVAAVVSQFAVDHPDGLERVAIDHGFSERATDHALSGGVFADYATRGVSNEALGLAIAGLSGAALTLLAGYALFAASRRLNPPAV